MNKNLEELLRADRRICATCNWWDLTFAETDTDEYPQSLCRACPPKAGKKKKGYTPAVWPLTACDDWCSAWRKRDPLWNQ